MRERILTVARDVALRARIAGRLKEAGYGVELAENAEHARRIGLKGIALAVVAADGLGSQANSLIAELEERAIKFLTLADAADEAALLARISEALKPVKDARTEEPEPVLRFGSYRLDLAGHSLMNEGGTEVPLSRSEFSLLRAFVQRPGRVLSRDQLLNALAGRDAESYDRSIDMLVVRLRRKVEPDPKRPSLIVTIPGSGYKFTPKVMAETAPPTEAKEEIPSAAPRPGQPAAPERRQLTMLHCALAGEAFQTARRDPEDLQRLLAAFHENCRGIVSKAGGTVDRLLNDGVLAYFGYPQADEHQAERAVRAALSLIETVSRTDTGRLGTLRVRVGISTGLAVVGGQLDSPGQLAALGEPASIAASLAAQAGPDTVLMSGSTRRLVGELFEVRASSPVALNGADEPVEAWQVIAEAAVGSRFEALRGSALAPLVGREDERDLLLRRWNQAKSGSGKVVLIMGEPGIGKSRLVRALQDDIADQDHIELRFFASPHHQNTTLHPTIIHMERAAGLAREDSAETRRAKLEAMLTRWEATDEAVALVAELLSIPTEQRERIQQLSPQVRRERTLASLLAQLTGLAARKPVLLIHEDVHWVDATSRELIDRTVEAVACTRVLALATARPGFKPSWIEQPHVTTLSLNRLNPQEAAALVNGVTGGRAVGDTTLEAILARAEGVPLFVEEITKAVLESGGSSEAKAPVRSEAVIPTSLHDSLVARLDRLEAGRELAQIGAVIGREFTQELLSTVIEQPAASLDPALSQLVRSELVFHTGTPPDARYIFKHALVQQAAYESLLRSRRQELHARVAKALSERFPDEIEHRPQIVLHHATMADDHPLAVRACIAGAERSLRLSANEEASALAERGLGHLDRLPHDAQKVRFLIKLLALKVYAAYKHGAEVPELNGRLQAAADAAKEMGLHSEATEALVATAWLHLWSNDPKGAGLSSLRAEEASRAADPVTRCRQIANTGRCLLEVEQQIPRALALVDEAEVMAATLGLEFEELDWARAHMARWKGDLDRARERMSRAVELARLGEERWREVECLIALATIEIEREQYAEAIRYCEEIDKITIHQNLTMLPTSAAIRAVAQLMSSATESLSSLDEAIASLRAFDDKAHLAYVLNLQAQYLLAKGRWADASAAATEAVALARAMPRITEIVVGESILVRTHIAAGNRSAALVAFEALAAECDFPTLSDRARANIEGAAQELGIPAPSPSKRKPNRVCPRRPAT